MADISDKIESNEADPSSRIARVELLSDEFANFAFVIFLFAEDVVDDFGNFIFELVSHVRVSNNETVEFV